MKNKIRILTYTGLIKCENTIISFKPMNLGEPNVVFLFRVKK